MNDTDFSFFWGFSSFVEVDVLLLEDPLRNFTIDFCTPGRNTEFRSVSTIQSTHHNQVGVESAGRCQCR